jgi:hypothetical protein
VSGIRRAEPSGDRSTENLARYISGTCGKLCAPRWGLPAGGSQPSCQPTLETSEATWQSRFTTPRNPHPNFLPGAMKTAIGRTARLVASPTEPAAGYASLRLTALEPFASG